jgi:hypothetical protein
LKTTCFIWKSQQYQNRAFKLLHRNFCH